ncbi:MAG TPA: AAA domain-containing protein, partial [Thermomicrobiaceae bacterium]|nr:AAA domain-containing protein [Thermomicrobiaceae bacterium]
ALIAQLVAELMQGIPESRWDLVMRQIGVIAPYRRQNNLIQQELRAIDARLREIRVDTVDRFQGGEREIVIVSLVNSNAARSIGSLHADWRRMNVAVSRARRKLVIVGDRETFTREESRPEEADARARYRRLFTELDQLIAEGEAMVVGSLTLDSIQRVEGDVPDWAAMPKVRGAEPPR